MKRSIALAVVAGLALVLVLPSTALAFTRRVGDRIRVDDSISDDLYLFGTNIEVTGDVDGDVVAFGTDVRIAGEVTGDVIVAGESITVSGPVGGSVRAAGNDVDVDGAVSEDAVVAGNNVLVASSVGRDAVVAGSSVSLDGDIARNVLAGAATLGIDGAVGGDVTADVDRLSLSAGSAVAGDLTYYSGREATIDGDVRGEVTRRPQRFDEEEPSALATVMFAVLHWLRALVGFAILALLVILLARPLVERAAHQMWFVQPWLSLGIGLGLMLIAFPVAVLVFVVGLLIGGWWLAFVWLSFLWLLALMGLVVGTFAIGRWIVESLMHRAAHPVVAALVGVAVLSLVGAIPIIGGLVFLAVILAGTGAVILLYRTPTVAPQAIERRV